MRRKTVYVCVSIENGNLVNKIISANSKEEAESSFLKETSLKPKDILGPFYEKRLKINKQKEIKFSNETKKAIFNGWIVNAFLLKEPENYAYLIFIKRLDDKKMTPPSGIVTVPISDLRII